MEGGKVGSRGLVQGVDDDCGDYSTTNTTTYALNNTTTYQYDDHDSSTSTCIGSTLLSLSLNYSHSHQHQQQQQQQQQQKQQPQPLLNQHHQPLTQLGLLQVKLEQVKKENQDLRFMLNQVTGHYATLQNRLLLTMQQHQLSSSPTNSDNPPLLKKDCMERPVFPTHQFLNTGDGGIKTERFASMENIQMNMDKGSLASPCNVEGKISSQIASQEEQAYELASSRKARVSIRARSNFALMGDGCQWRKYGQKTSKGNPCPRAYYRCSMGTACPVRKQVQRCSVDETVLITTYEGNHNHALPPAARSIASTTTAALNMLLSGSSTSSSKVVNISNYSGLYSSFSSSAGSTGLATFSQSASCPTVTLDLTVPSNNNYMKFQRDASSNIHRQPLPTSLNGHTQESGSLHLSSELPALVPSDKNLALVDVVSAAITKDPSLKAALFAAVSSLTGDNGNKNILSEVISKSDCDPSIMFPVVSAASPALQPRSVDLEL